VLSDFDERPRYPIEQPDSTAIRWFPDHSPDDIRREPPVIILRMSGTSWCLVVMQLMGGGQEKYWSLGGELPVTGGLEEAIRAAQHVAWSHRPAHPRTERGRRVYRVDERRWLVAVTGQGTAYPFEIRIVQAEPPPAPSP